MQEHTTLPPETPQKSAPRLWEILKSRCLLFGVGVFIAGGIVGGAATLGVCAFYFPEGIAKAEKKADVDRAVLKRLDGLSRELKEGFASQTQVLLSSLSKPSFSGGGEDNRAVSKDLDAFRAWLSGFEERQKATLLASPMMGGAPAHDEAGVIAAFGVFSDHFSNHRPYRDALVPLRFLAMGETLARLDAYADVGVPSREDLRARLEDLVRVYTRPASLPKAGEGVIEKGVGGVVWSWILGVISLEKVDDTRYYAWGNRLEAAQRALKAGKDRGVWEALREEGVPRDIQDWLQAFGSLSDLEQAREDLAFEVLSGLLGHSRGIEQKEEE